MAVVAARLPRRPGHRGSPAGPLACGLDL